MLSSEHSHHILKRRLINFRVVELSRLAASYRLSQLLMIVSENKTQRSFPEINKKLGKMHMTYCLAQKFDFPTWAHDDAGRQSPKTVQSMSRQSMWPHAYSSSFVCMNTNQSRDKRQQYNLYVPSSDQINQTQGVKMCLTEQKSAAVSYYIFSLRTKQVTQCSLPG